MANMLTSSDQASLFPILQPSPDDPPEMKGIARLAPDASHADEGHLIEFRALQARSILNNVVSRRGLYFSKSINPYRGCEFACRYCYARYTHEYMELRRPEDFERKIFIKQNAAWLLQQELRHLGPEEEIAIGTATDPYQPIERRARITRSLLEVLAGHEGLRIGLVTKSTLIERDIELLQKIAGCNHLVLHLTITTPNAKLARILEPRAPRPDLRLRTVSRLRRAGLRTGILCSPLLPGITDTLAALDGMAAKARHADASFFSAQPLFLKPCSRETYMNFVRENFPKLEQLYNLRFSSSAFVSADYSKRIEKLVNAVIAKHGLNRRSMDAIITHEDGPALLAKSPQSSIWPISATAVNE